MNPAEQAKITLDYYATAGVLTFWVDGPFLHAATDDRYKYAVSDPAALEILTRCYAERQENREAE